MKELINTNIKITALDISKYEMLINYLEDNNVNYEELDTELFAIDQRSEDEKYEDWLNEQADLHNDNVAIGIE